MMRKTMILSIALASVALGAAAGAQRDPRERFELRTPIAKPKPSNGASGAPIQDQGVHNAVHAAHQSQIVFLRKDVGIGAITEADIVSDFTLGQPMFFRVFTEKSAVNAIAAVNNMPASDVYAVGVRYTARFTIGGKVIETTMWPWGNPQDHQTWTTWRGQFVNTINAQRTPGTDIFMEMLSKATAAGLLKPGKHSIKMEVVPEVAVQEGKFANGGTVASGTFNLTVPAGIFQASNAAVCGPARGATASAALEARALSEARRVIGKPDYTPVRAVGIGDGWDVDRNEITGIPIQRDTTVAILARGAKYCSANIHYFIEDYMGGGNFGTSTGSISLKATPRYIPCACLD
jgi:hypothetical protein